MDGMYEESDTGYTTLDMKNKTKGKKPQWRIVERRARGDAGVVVSELPLPVPRYSFRVGTAKFDRDKGELYVTPFLSVFNVDDAISLLRELSEVYIEKREAVKDELDAERERWEL